MPNVTPLSEREKDVLQLVASGLTNREIAQKLGISPNTVKVHLSNIFDKISVASRTEATVYAIEHRIVDVPGSEEVSDETTKHQWVPWIIASVLILLTVTLILIVSDVFVPFLEDQPLATQNPAARWKELSSLPEPRSDMAAVAYNDDIYVIAGKGESTVSGTVFQYLSESDRWVELTEKPTPVSDIQGVLIGEKIYIPGGKLANGETTDVLEIYDPRRGVWELGSSLPQAVCSYALAAFEGQLFLFGGWDGWAGTSSVFIYDPGSDAWRNGTSMPTANYGAGAVAFNDRIIIMGGLKDESLLISTQVYFPSRDGDGEKPWESYLDLPAGLENLSIANIYDTVYVFGLAGETSDDNQIGFVLIDDQWKTLIGTNDFIQEDTQIIPVGSVLYVLNSVEPDTPTEFWVYQAYYYEIYLPIIP